MRTLALFPPVLAINPSRIRIWRVTKLFQPSVATKNLRSTSSGIELFRFSSDIEAGILYSEVPAAWVVERVLGSGCRRRLQEAFTVAHFGGSDTF
jgi:hypothetical protein